jgi:hypothetical protein
LIGGGRGVSVVGPRVGFGSCSAVAVAFGAVRAAGCRTRCTAWLMVVGLLEMGPAGVSQLGGPLDDQPTCGLGRVDPLPLGAIPYSGINPPRSWESSK